MRSLNKILMIAITTVGLCAAGTWSVSTFQKNGSNYGFGNGGTNVTSFANPYGIAVGSDGSIFVSDASGNVLRKFSLDPAKSFSNSYSAPTIVAGDGTAGNADGNGIAAQFNGPNGLAIRPDTTPPSVFIADSLGGQTIRQMLTTSPYTVNTPAALGYNPQNLVFTDTNTLYVSDSGNSIYKYTYNGTNWSNAGTATASSEVGGLTSFGSNLYYTAGSDVYKIDSALTSSTSIVTGATGSDFAGIVESSGVLYSGVLYVADTGNHTICKLSTSDKGANWTVSTIAGTGTASDIDGDGTTATFNQPTAITADQFGELYITDAGSNLIRRLRFIPSKAEIEKFASAFGAPGSAIFNAVVANLESAVEGMGEGTSETGIHFGFSPQRIKMEIRSINNGALASYDKSFGDYGSMLKALESSLGATQPLVQTEGGVALWASGVYANGHNKILYGNPASTDKHYGIMVGTHYYHKPTRQIIGIAFDAGTGGSAANENHQLKNLYKSAQGTIYYGFGITNAWRVNLNMSHMAIRSSHHRPYGTNGANTIALSQSKSSATSFYTYTTYKFKPSEAIHLKPSAGISIAYTKQNAYAEYNAGSHNMQFQSASMAEVVMKTGFKASFFHKQDESTFYGIYPQISFIRYLKAGKMKQKAGLVNSGTLQTLQSGTPGKNLTSLTIGAGVEQTNGANSTKYQMAYTANFQRYRRSQEVMFKGIWQF